VRRSAVLPTLAVALAAALAACSSPEASRSRGQGAGADVGNRGPEVTIRATKDPYRGTPRRGAGR
jgi:hypothetical protein